MATHSASPQLIFAEGRLGEINVSFEHATATRLDFAGDPNSPVIVQFNGRRGFYIRVYDHRKRSIEAYARYREDRDRVAFEAAFAVCPALVRFAQKNGTQYIAITDCGVEDMVDSGEDEQLILTIVGVFDHKAFYAPDGAIHHPSGICLVAPRPPKEEEAHESPSLEHSDAETPAEPVNTQLRDALQARLS